MQVLAREDDAITRFVVDQLLSKGQRRAAALAEASQFAAPAEADSNSACLGTLCEDATELATAEERRIEATTKLQAWVRGRHVRQRRARMEKSAITLQRAFRRLRGSQGWRKHSAAVGVVSGQRREWAMEFQKAADAGGLKRSGFLHALRGACGDKASEAQAAMLWAGFLEQHEAGELMLLSTFWAICEAVLKGDVWAAEFAGLAEEEYRDCSRLIPIAEPEAQASHSNSFVGLGTWVFYWFLSTQKVRQLEASRTVHLQLATRLPCHRGYIGDTLA